MQQSRARANIVKAVLTNLINLKKLHFKVQIGIWWDNTPRSSSPIPVVTRDFQNGLLTQTHLSNAFIPPTNDLPNTNLELEGTPLVPGGIELGTVASQRAAVVLTRERERERDEAKNSQERIQENVTAKKNSNRNLIHRERRSRSSYT